MKKIFLSSIQQQLATYASMSLAGYILNVASVLLIETEVNIKIKARNKTQCIINLILWRYFHILWPCNKNEFSR